ncbi:hypothetical protein ACQ4PT_045089 [Festuca glaucescens]
MGLGGVGWRRVGSKVQIWGWENCLRVRGFSSAAVPSHMESVGFIGLGNMGCHMARNLINAGYRVSVHDVNENAMKKFLDDGIPTKRSPLEVSESSDVVITMLPSSTHVLDVYSGGNGLLGYAEKPMMVDAPVSGGVPAAEAGTLTFMAKNLDLAMASASDVGYKYPMGSEALDIYQKLCDEG